MVHKSDIHIVLGCGHHCLFTTGSLLSNPPTLIFRDHIDRSQTTTCCFSPCLLGLAVVFPSLSQLKISWTFIYLFSRFVLWLIGQTKLNYCLLCYWFVVYYRLLNISYLYVLSKTIRKIRLKLKIYNDN